MEFFKLKILENKYNRAKDLKNNFEPILRELYYYALPSKYRFNFIDPEKSITSAYRLYDTTLVSQVRECSAFLNYLLWSRGLEPVKVEVNKEYLEQENPQFSEEQLNDHITLLNKKFYEALSQSNFYNELSKAFPEFVACTGALKILPTKDKKNPISCEAVNLAELYLEENSDGYVKTVWHKLNNIPINQLPGLLGKDMKIPEGIKEKNKDGVGKITLIDGTIYNEEEKNYIHIIITEDWLEVLVEEKLKTSPWIIFRSESVQRSPYGNSIVLDAISIAKNLDELEESRLEADRYSWCYNIYTAKCSRSATFAALTNTWHND